MNNGTKMIEILSWVKGLRFRKKEGNSGFMRELRNIRLSWKAINEVGKTFYRIRINIM